jgi:hypothetical protein
MNEPTGSRGHPLESLRCPKGCNPDFIQYLEWKAGNGGEGSAGLRICDDRQMGRRTVFDLGLRCGECSTHYGKKGVSAKVKTDLDKILTNNNHAIQDLVDQVDLEIVEAYLGEARP